MKLLSLSQINQYRKNTFHTTPGSRIAERSQAVDFVNERGFIFFWPITGITYPSLWAAVAGDRPVADEHDDPGHITWGWKDELLGKHAWYYGRVLRRRNTIISLQMLPNFYALSPNYGDPEQDYLIEYEQGLLTQEAKSVYEALLREGPLDTISLRKAARLRSSSNEGRFAKALDDLQVDFRVLPVGTAEAGAWHYAFVYDLVHRHYPQLVEDAGNISEVQARQHLLRQFFVALGASAQSDAAKMFRWTPAALQRTIHGLVDGGFLAPIEMENSRGSAFAWIGALESISEA
jgi:hypothetical protein